MLNIQNLFNMWVFRRITEIASDKELRQWMAACNTAPFPSKVVYQVGFFCPGNDWGNGQWEAVSSFDKYQDAANEVHFLNGGDEIRNSNYLGGVR